MTRDLHYVSGDTKHARLEALVRRHGDGVWEVRYAKRDKRKNDTQKAQIKGQKGGIIGWQSG